MDSNILIIGNGFDLTHGLPTRYIDFLKYCQDYDEHNPISSSVELNKEFDVFLSHNIWLKYFLGLVPDLGSAKTWIDFEKEIAEVVQFIELEFWQTQCVHYINAPSQITFELLLPDKPKDF